MLEGDKACKGGKKKNRTGERLSRSRTVDLMEKLTFEQYLKVMIKSAKQLHRGRSSQAEWTPRAKAEDGVSPVSLKKAGGQCGQSCVREDTSAGNSREVTDGWFMEDPADVWGL